VDLVVELLLPRAALQQEVPLQQKRKKKRKRKRVCA
jgi:hypothetical protein